MNTSYNPVSFNYIHDKFKDVALDERSQEMALIHQEHTYFSVLLSEYEEPNKFQESWHHKYQG